MRSITVNELQQVLMFGLQPLVEGGMLIHTSDQDNYSVILRESEGDRKLVVKHHESGYAQDLELKPTTGGGWIAKPLGGELECIQDDQNGVAMRWFEGYDPYKTFSADNAMNVEWGGKKYSPSRATPNGPVEFGDFNVSKIVDPQLGETIHVEHVDGWTLTVVRRQEQAALAGCAAMGVKIVG